MGGEGGAPSRRPEQTAALRLETLQCPPPANQLLRRKSVPSGYGRDGNAARYDLRDDPGFVLGTPRAPATCAGEYLKPMNRLIHCVHPKPSDLQIKTSSGR
jgi:hypothetical protein